VGSSAFHLCESTQKPECGFAVAALHCNTVISFFLASFLNLLLTWPWPSRGAAVERSPGRQPGVHEHPSPPCPSPHAAGRGVPEAGWGADFPTAGAVGYDLSPATRAGAKRFCLLHFAF
jgi:hypothetical protein